MSTPFRRFDSRERELGLDRPITRRDFLNSTVLGAGAALLSQHAPSIAQTLSAGAPTDAAAFDGFAGVGDYARSNGNTWQVVRDAHAMRDGKYRPLSGVKDTQESYDVVVVGGGFSGLGAAHRVMQLGAGQKTCLVLDNHKMFGGEAKRNEFLVADVRLLAPQGSNECVIPDGESVANEVWTDLGLPRHVAYSELPESRKRLECSRSNYIYQLWGDNFESHGFYFPDEQRWVTNPWMHGLAGVPWPDALKREMMRWREDTNAPQGVPPAGNPRDRWLDSMSYEQYLTQVMALPAEVARYADPILAAAGGLGSDVTSAYMANGFGMPGFQALQSDHASTHHYSLRGFSQMQRFPGGNDGIARAFVKRLVPQAIEGGTDYADIHNGAVRFEALDRQENPTRIRLSSTIVAVEHAGARDRAERVAVTYLRDGRLFRVHARGVVMAGGCWTAKHVVRDLPAEYRDAMEKFHRSPMLIVNVALTNWRALYKLGYTAASWRGGQLGFSFNLSPPMQVGSYAPPFDPDRPAILTYYVPFTQLGLPVEQQGMAARARMLSKSYYDYELAVRAQLTDMLGAQGFDARRDIAGIILNRWGHAYVNPYPGFYFGRDGKPAPRDIVRTQMGRIAFGHSELRGHQYWDGGVEEGRRAAEQVLGFTPA